MIRHALNVLKEFAENGDAKRGPAVQLALRVLLTYQADRYYLDVFWRLAAPGGDRLARRKGLIATYGAISGIRHRL